MVLKYLKGCCSGQSDADILVSLKKRKHLKKLKDLDVFVLDNTLRESVVGNVISPTVEDKLRVLDLITGYGVKYMIVAAFAKHVRVDDKFLEALIDRKFPLENCFAFSEIVDEVEDGVPRLDQIPVGLQKMKTYGIPNAILEVDIGCLRADPNKQDFVETLCRVIQMQVDWCRENLSPVSKVFINLRDFGPACEEFPERLIAVVRFLARMKPQPFGLLFEDSTGTYLPSQMSHWVKNTREVMVRYGWGKAPFLIHVHKGFGMAEATVLECLAKGCTGIWCSVCETGVVTGAACQAITLTNLAREGNAKVTRDFDFPKLREAAVEITKILTGSKPPPNTEIYGERALETVFPAGGMYTGGFDLNALFGQRECVRLTTFTTSEMYAYRMELDFGIKPSEKTCVKMRAVMLHDASSGKKLNHNTSVGCALLYERAGGTIAAPIWEKVFNDAEELMGVIEVKQMRQAFETCCEEDEFLSTFDKTLNTVSLQAFAKCFVEPHMGTDPQLREQALEVFDPEKSNCVKWEQLLLRTLWAVQEHRSECTTAQATANVIVKHLILPCLQARAMSKRMKKNFRAAKMVVKMNKAEKKFDKKPESPVTKTKTSKIAI